MIFKLKLKGVSYHNSPFTVSELYEFKYNGKHDLPNINESFKSKFIGLSRIDGDFIFEYKMDPNVIITSLLDYELSGHAIEEIDLVSVDDHLPKFKEYENAVDQFKVDCLNNFTK